jgi:hypothetical protein
MERLKPKITHTIDQATLEDLETQLHQIMTEKVGQVVSLH